MECIQEMVVSYEPIKALDLLSCSSAGFTVVDNMRERMGGWGLGGMMGGSGVGEQKADRWGWAVRNSSMVGCHL